MNHQDTKTTMAASPGLAGRRTPGRRITTISGRARPRRAMRDPRDRRRPCCRVYPWRCGSRPPARL